MGRTVEVQILGKNFTFNLPEDVRPEDFMEVIAMVQGQLARIRGIAVDLDFFKLALLAAVNLAEECHRLRKENHLMRNVLTGIDQAVTPVVDEQNGRSHPDKPIAFSVD